MGAALTSGLFCVFGISSWVTVNGIFAQLPLLAGRQPEGWALGSHLGLAVQLANVGPAMYIAHRRCAQRHTLAVSTTIYAVLSCSLLSMLALVRCLLLPTMLVCLLTVRPCVVCVTARSYSRRSGKKRL